MERAVIEKLIKSLERNNMKGYFVNDENELIELIKSLVPENSIVGGGDSVTLEDTNVYNFFRNGNYTFYDKYREGITREEKDAIYIKNFSADTFVSGTNAITMDGKLFNIDGYGNRLAPIVYGPKQVIIVVGINKIVDNVEEAIKRTRQIAAPLDAVRLKVNTPCIKLKKCIDCNHKERICNAFVLIAGQFTKDRIKVIIINKELGY